MRKKNGNAIQNVMYNGTKMNDQIEGGKSLFFTFRKIQTVYVNMQNDLLNDNNLKIPLMKQMYNTRVLFQLYYYAFLCYFF